MKRFASFPPMAPPAKRTDAMTSATVPSTAMPLGARTKDAPPELPAMTSQASPRGVLVTKKAACHLVAHVQRTEKVRPPAPLIQKARPPKPLPVPTLMVRPPAPLTQKARPTTPLPVPTLIAVTKASFEVQRQIWRMLAQLREPPLQLALEDVPR
jgi:hypothetical protein